MKKHMATYPENIMQALEANRISCSYDKGERLVYVCYSGHFGEIYSIYSQGDQGSLLNFTLYPYTVSDSRLEEVERCLAVINEQASPVNFYVDPVTGCIAFYNRYLIPPNGDGNGEGIIRFCMETHQACLKHQIPLYVLTGGCQKKEKHGQ